MSIIIKKNGQNVKMSSNRYSQKIVHLHYFLLYTKKFGENV